MNLVVSGEYPLYYNDPTETPEQQASHKPVQWGTPGQIFDTNQTFQKEMSVEIGVALTNTARAYDVMTAAPAMQDYPGLLAFRWVKGFPGPSWLSLSFRLRARLSFQPPSPTEPPTTMMLSGAVWKMQASHTRFIGDR